MSELKYSTDEETFDYDDIGEALCSIFECDDTLDVGTIITVYSGEKEEKKASNYSTWIVENLSQNAFDDMSEHSGDWPNCTKEQEKELEDAIDKLVDEWADEHNLQPTFYGIKNQKKIKVKILNIETGDFEVLEA